MTDTGDSSLTHGALHHAILRGLLDTQRAPTVRELCARFASGEEVIRAALRALADYHGVVLHPLCDEVWVAHPFATAPTPFVVEAGGRRWWASCAWCSLGVLHLAGGNGSITTTLGALGDRVTLRAERGVLLDADFVVHFPVPMTRAWDNVIYTCSVMLLFRTEEDVDDWCATRGVARGDVQPVARVWAFAKDWYGRHLDPDWRKWTVAEAAAMFARHRLDGPVWSLPTSSGRF